MKEALKLAKIALDDLEHQRFSWRRFDALVAIGTALAQPAQETKIGCVQHDCDECTARLAQRQWVGLTDDELADLWYKESLDWMEFACAHEAALKEKNFD